MAMMIESVGSQHISGSTSSSSPATPSARALHVAAPCPCPRISLPRCRGLRIMDAPSKLSSPSPLSSLNAISVYRRGTVVCKQDILNCAGDVTDKTWKELVLDSEIPVLVDIWAPWCGPCRMIAPLFDELAIQYAGEVRCLKLNTDDCPTIATDCGIRSIPTVMIFKNGQKKDAIVGAVSKAALISALEKFLDK